MTAAFVGIGSNLGDREAQVEAAFRALDELPDTGLEARSRIFESRAVGPGDQGHYLNAVAKISTALDAAALLEALQEIERRAGRVRRERWGPRTLDLDLLLFGDQRIRVPGLVVPHPRMTQRNFVMEPLADVAASKTLLGRSVRQHAEFLRDDETLWLWRL